MRRQVSKQKNKLVGLVPIFEYHNGDLKHVWSGPEEAARFHHVHPSTIKELIFYGNPLPSSSNPLITFDLENSCKYDIIKVDPEDGDRRKTYRVVRVSDGCIVDFADE